MPGLCGIVGEVKTATALGPVLENDGSAIVIGAANPVVVIGRIDRDRRFVLRANVGGATPEATAWARISLDVGQDQYPAGVPLELLLRASWWN